MNLLNYFYLPKRFIRTNLKLAFNIEEKGYKPINRGRYVKEDLFLLQFRDYLIPKKDGVISLMEKDYKKYLVLNFKEKFGVSFLIEQPNYFYEYPNFYILSLVTDCKPDYEKTE